MSNTNPLEWWTFIFIVILAFVIFASILTVFIGSIMSAGTVTEDDFQDYSRAPDILSRIQSKLRKGKTLSSEEDRWLQWAISVGLVELSDDKEYIPGRLMRRILTPELRMDT